MEKLKCKRRDKPKQGQHLTRRPCLLLTSYFPLSTTYFSLIPLSLLIHDLHRLPVHQLPQAPQDQPER
jgi:hypothetical protein